MTLAAILRAVPTEMKSSITEKKSANKVWTVVKTMRMGDEHVREMNTQKLLMAFENVKFQHGGTMGRITSGIAMAGAAVASATTTTITTRDQASTGVVRVNDAGGTSIVAWPLRPGLPRAEEGKGAPHRH